MGFKGEHVRMSEEFNECIVVLLLKKTNNLKKIATFFIVLTKPVQRCHSMQESLLYKFEMFLETYLHFLPWDGAVQQN